MLRSPVWSTALFVGPDPLEEDCELPDRRPDVLFDTYGLKLASDALHTVADPFLFVDEAQDECFLFLEEQRRGAPGRIAAWRISDDLTADFEGIVNVTGGHVSYPFVFAQGGTVYLLPETGSLTFGQGTGEVALYAFTAFPTKVEKVATLLVGPFFDSCITRVDDLFYLFTYRDGEGLLLLSDRVEGPYRPHPSSPFSTDPAVARCGGALLPPSGGRAFTVRPAQDCSTSYGGDLNLLRVKTLTPDLYEEAPWRDHVLARRYPWSRTGGHHLSQAVWRGRHMTAVDGRRDDLLINRVVGGLLHR